VPSCEMVENIGNLGKDNDTETSKDEKVFTHEGNFLASRQLSDDQIQKSTVLLITESSFWTNTF
jgi:hypothetical protein